MTLTHIPGFEPQPNLKDVKFLFGIFGAKAVGVLAAMGVGRSPFEAGPPFNRAVVEKELVNLESRGFVSRDGDAWVLNVAAVESAVNEVRP